MPEIISRKEARERGLKRYFTGVPCKQGHLAERGADGDCSECRRVRARKYALRAYYANHEDNKARAMEKARVSAAFNPVIRANKLRRAASEESRGAAIAQGLKHFEGSPCPAGHTTRYTSDSHCVRCNSKYAREPPFVLRECVICEQIFHPLRNSRAKTCSALCKQALKGAYAMARYRADPKRHIQYQRNFNLNGPSNPNGEKQWLKKHRAILRSLKRVLKNPSVGLPSGLQKGLQT